MVKAQHMPSIRKFKNQRKGSFLGITLAQKYQTYYQFILFAFIWKGFEPTMAGTLITVLP